MNLGDDTTLNYSSHLFTETLKVCQW